MNTIEASSTTVGDGLVAAYSNSSTAKVALEERLINNKENSRVEVESATSSSAPSAVTVTRVITKESLQQPQPQENSNINHHQQHPPVITSAQDEHSLFEFSYLDSEDRAERELLSLPLTAIELPLHTSLTPEPHQDEEVELFDININNITAANSFETCAATLLTPATATTTTAVSEYSLSSYSTEGSDRGSSGSLLSTAAAIAAVQPRPTDREEQEQHGYSNNTTELPFLHQPSLTIQAPPLVSVATTATASAPTPTAIVSPKLKAKRRPRANSKSSTSSANKKNKKKAATIKSTATRKQSPRSKAKAISPIFLPPVPAENINISTASTSTTVPTTPSTTTRLVPKYKVNINMEEQEQALMNMNAPSVGEGQLPAIAVTATAPAPPVPQALSVTVPTPTTIAVNVATTTRPITAAAAAAQSNTGHPIALVPTTTPSGQPLPPKQFVPPPASAAAPTTTSYVTQQVITNPPPPQQPQSSSRARAQSTASASSQSNTVTTVHPSGQVENTGRWTAEEHRLFLQGLQEHGKGWKKIATLIKSRTVVQIRTHAQKYFQKLAKARQNGETVAGVGMGTVGGAVTVTGVTVNGTPLTTANGSTPMVHGIGTNENGETIGITIPVGPDGQPVVTMRTTTTPNSTYHASNMSVGCDPTSLAAAAGNVGIATAGGVVIPRVSRGGGGGGRKRNSASGGGTKRRAIGNVVRSAVREGRNVKRQRIAEGKRKSGGRGGASAASAAAHPADAGVAEAPVPNPLPAVSNVLDPYVTATMGAMPPPPAPPASAGTNAATTKKTNGRGRQQMVHTSTHGTLPMAALEDAVFRLLTPATGAPSPPQPQPAPSSSNGIVDPLAPAPVASSKIAMSHTQYHPTPPTSGTYPQGTVANPSPTGVADMSLLPSWVDAKNPPSWYNDGGDIDTLLEDADCLNWLSDTGDLNETYPPAMAEPAAVVSSASTTVPGVGVPDQPLVGVQDPTGGVVHPSTESLSFLVDPPEHHVGMIAHPAVAAQFEDVNQLPSFLEDAEAHAALSGAATVAFSSATEAVEAAVEPAIPEHKLTGVGESDTNLMGFPDLDMGDEQAFVSALLENNGQSHMSFPKLGSDMHLASGLSGVALSGVMSSGVLKEDQLDEAAA